MIVGLLGGTGLVGSHIAYALRAAGYGVRLAYRSEAALEHARRVFSLYADGAMRFVDVDCVRVDLLDAEGVSSLASGCDAVVHAAALVTLGGGGHGALAARMLASVAVDACLAAGVPGMVYVGSIAVLPGVGEGEAIGEEGVHADLRRLGDYALGKSEAEREVLRGRAEGLRVSILNPGVVLAPPTRQGSSASLVRWAQRGSRYYPTGLLAWVDVRDVSAGVVSALAQGVPNARCTLVGGGAEYREVLDAFAARYGGVRARYAVPWGVARWVAGGLAWLGRLGVRCGRLDADTVRAGYSRHRYSVGVAQTQFVLSYRTLRESIDFIARSGV